jgi:DoxX-like family
MKKNKIIYWSTTSILSLMMLFSAYSYFYAPEAIEGFKKFGFPDYFRIELGFAKGLAALLLIIPQVPNKIKEWSYAGLSITFVSASYAHFKMADPVAMFITPLIFLGLLITSNIYLYKK